NIDNHTVERHAQAFGSRSDDALVGLMRNKGIDVGSAEAVTSEQLFGKFRHLSYCILEDGAAVLVNDMHLLVHGLVSGGMQAAAAGHVQRASAGAIHFVQKIDQSQVF